MLPLILSDRDSVGSNDQDIGRHQYRVGEKTMIGRDTLLNFIFVRMATFEQTHRGNCCQQPLQLTNLGYIALQVYGAAFGIQPESQIVHSRIAGELQQLLPVAYRGKRVIVGQEVVALMSFLDEMNELLDRTEIIAEVQIPEG